MKTKRPVSQSLEFSKISLQRRWWAKEPLRGIWWQERERRIYKDLLLFVGYLMIVTNASIGVAFCLGSILPVESVIFEWSLHGVSCHASSRTDGEMTNSCADNEQPTRRLRTKFSACGTLRSFLSRFIPRLPMRQCHSFYVTSSETAQQRHHQAAALPVGDATHLCQ